MENVSSEALGISSLLTGSSPAGNVSIGNDTDLQNKSSLSKAICTLNFHCSSGKTGTKELGECPDF